MGQRSSPLPETVTVMKIALGVLMSVALLAGQNAGGTPDAHVALAKAAAGDAHQNLFDFLCTVPASRGPAPRGEGPYGPAQRGGQIPAIRDRSTWYVEPVKVFDNLYFVGQSEYSAWAVKTLDGIILIDTLFD
jgi:metallo-beta-lactamase class B